jgi:hypothetical protein
MPSGQRPLLPQELPPSLVSYFDLAGQWAEGDRMWVRRACLTCGNVRPLMVKVVRKALRLGKLTGRCAGCNPRLPVSGQRVQRKPRALHDNGDAALIRATVTSDAAFCSWFAGLFDGEGSFNLTHRVMSGKRDFWSVGVYIGMRDDDLATLVGLQVRLGGFISHPPALRAVDGSVKKRSVTWSISTLLGCSALVELFDRYPLRSRKKRHLVVWRQAVEHLVARRLRADQDEAFLQRLLEQLHAERAYQEESAG